MSRVTSLARNEIRAAAETDLVVVVLLRHAAPRHPDHLPRLGNGDCVGKALAVTYVLWKRSHALECRHVRAGKHAEVARR